MTMAANCDLESIHIGCTRSSSAADWSTDGTVALAANRFVALYQPEIGKPNRGIVKTLPGHKDRVNCVRFVRRGSGLKQKDVALLSGSADGTCRIWKQNENGEWHESGVLEGHTSAVVCIAAMRGRDIMLPYSEEFSREADILASGASDGTIRIWHRIDMGPAEKDIVRCIQTINVGARYAMCMSLAMLPNVQVPILVTGGTDKKVHVYVQSRQQTEDTTTSSQFVHSVSLQGHTDWIRSMDIATYSSISSSSAPQYHQFRNGDLIIATGSQDKYIRLWKISDITDGNSASASSSSSTDSSNQDSSDLTQDLLDALANAEVGDGGLQLSTKAHLLEVPSGSASDGTPSKKRYSILFDALLLGHDDWVHGLSWHPAVERDQAYFQPMQLLSASADKSVILWEPDDESGVWITKVRVGEIGGTTHGYYGAIFAPGGSMLLAHNYNGAVQIWAKTERHIASEPIEAPVRKDEDDEDEEEVAPYIPVRTDDEWKPLMGTGGHFASVEDLVWDPTGLFVVTVSMDQTTRLLSEWKQAHDGTTTKTWHEIARPQIHGYDLHCLAFVNKYGFVCGADEKVIRAFEAPKTFIESLANLTGERDGASEQALDQTTSDGKERPAGASLPALGLSNKAVFPGDLQSAAATHDFRNLQSYTSASATPTSLIEILSEPPFEPHLMQHTLWPEVDKLYGHGYEIITLAASHDGKIVASACKATKTEHAALRLWSTKTWKELPCSPLLTNPPAHSLTVTAVRFSHDDTWMCSVGRDRGWALYRRRGGDEDPSFELVTLNPKAHARIIWDCCWAFDDSMFATASRDKTVKIWAPASRSGNDTEWKWNAVAVLKFAESVTAVDFSPSKVQDGHLLAVGLETGEIFVYHVNNTAGSQPDGGISSVECKEFVKVPVG
ncbi:Elongator subunit elp2 [Quaeritorhiza haematococci]|nr:Elongator subunit elp2 [Quaeritorhiza haematococci]